MVSRRGCGRQGRGTTKAERNPRSLVRLSGHSGQEVGHTQAPGNGCIRQMAGGGGRG